MAILHQLRLRDFRNYSRLDLEFRPGVNFLVGSNGQGKTNLLEAIYFLSLLRSFRTARTREICAWGKQGFFVGGRVGRENGDDRGTSLAVGVGTRRRMRIDGRVIRRATEYINSFHCVAMVSEDIRLIRGPGSERRRFIDILLSQKNFDYMAVLAKYKRLVRTRNAMLRSPTRFGLSVLAAFDEQLIDAGVRLTMMREGFMQSFAALVSLEWQNLAGKEAPELGIEYDSMVIRGANNSIDEQALKSQYRIMLEGTRNQDSKEGWTRVGPHRDDLVFMLADHRLSAFGSEGQCRLVSLALRLGSVGFLSRVSAGNTDVVVLVDDVQGDLDGERREKFMARVMDCSQVFMVQTDISAAATNDECTVFRIDKGTVRSMASRPARLTVSRSVRRQ